ncbi:MAG TPA: glutathione peroxidase, partial [Bacteroidales bacterium]|nr:glutathione peroxidase [Bacteroidales bacterium]
MQCPESFYDFSATDIYGNNLEMSTFAGKKVMVVNTASFCGYTYQYADLQNLYETYGGDGNPYGFEIIGFPANNFNNQEPYDEEHIQDVCESYGVTFTMMSKISVAGTDQHEIYKWLTLQSRNCVQNAAVTRNFNKYLINRDGSWYAQKTQTVSPSHSSIVNWITDPTGISHDVEAIDRIVVMHSFDGAGLQMIVSLVASKHVQVEMFSIDGTKIADIYNGHIYGTTELFFNTAGLPSGLYFVK